MTQQPANTWEGAETGAAAMVAAAVTGYIYTKKFTLVDMPP